MRSLTFVSTVLCCTISSQELPKRQGYTFDDMWVNSRSAAGGNTTRIYSAAHWCTRPLLEPHLDSSTRVRSRVIDFAINWRLSPSIATCVSRCANYTCRDGKHGLFVRSPSVTVPLQRTVSSTPSPIQMRTVNTHGRNATACLVIHTRLSVVGSLWQLPPEQVHNLHSCRL